jgi:hypothetical protein
VWEYPAETAVALLMLLTVTGVLWLLLEPLPNRLEPPYPQHWTVPPESTAQVWVSPAETAVALLMLLTVTGVLWSLVKLLPN